jgi:hypothetical protein
VTTFTIAELSWIAVVLAAVTPAAWLYYSSIRDAQWREIQNLRELAEMQVEFVDDMARVMRTMVRHPQPIIYIGGKEGGTGSGQAAHHKARV